MDREPSSRGAGPADQPPSPRGPFGRLTGSQASGHPANSLKLAEGPPPGPQGLKEDPRPTGHWARGKAEGP